MQKLVLLLSLSCILTLIDFSNLAAQDDTFIFGRTTSTHGKSQQWSLSFRTKEFQKFPLTVDSIQAEKVFVDSRNWQMLVFGHIGARAMLATFDLNNGQRLQKFEFTASRLSNIVRDPLSGRIFAVARPKSGTRTPRMVEVNTDNGSLRWYEQTNIGFIWPCQAALDYVRGHYYLQQDGANSETVVYDINSGEIVKRLVLEVGFGVGVGFHSPEYDPVDDKFYGFLGSKLATPPMWWFVQHDPQTDKSTELNTWRSDEINTAYLDDCNTRIDAFNRRILALIAPTVIGIFDLNGDFIGQVPVTEAGRNQLLWDISNPDPLGTPLARVSGRIIADLDENCSLSAADVPLGNAVNRVLIGTRTVFTNADGEFVVYLPQGEFNISLPADSDWEINCSNPEPIVVQGTADEVVAVPDIFLQAPRVFERAEVSIVQSKPTPGQQVNYDITVKNSGLTQFTGELQFEYDERLTFNNITPVQSSDEPQILRWDVNDLAISQTFTIRLQAELAANEEDLGTELCAMVMLESAADVNIQQAPQSDQACSQIRALHAPNDISVSPRGFGESGEISPGDRTLAYTIRFQNTGEAPVRDVVILDTLDADLDIRTLSIGAASHPFSASIKKGRILEIRFESIDLPDKEQDDVASQGRLTFDVNLYEGLREGTQIYNRAAIYFDANKPVITNRVLNTVKDINVSVNESTLLSNYGDIPELKLELRSLGNDLFVLHRDPSLEPLSGRLSVHSILGTQVFETSLEAGSSTTVDLSQLVSGHYLIRVESRAAAWVRSVVVMR